MINVKTIDNDGRGARARQQRKNEMKSQDV